MNISVQRKSVAQTTNVQSIRFTMVLKTVEVVWRW